MLTSFFNYFHNKTVDRRDGGQVFVPDDKSLWPKSWKTIVYKSYKFYNAITLPKIEGNLFSTYLVKRKSGDYSRFTTPITLDQISYVLRCGYGLSNMGTENRTVPSAGRLFPLEVYLLHFNSSEVLSQGVYHYNIKDHSLEPLVKKEFSKDNRASLVQGDTLTQARGMICITGVFRRTTGKYGNRGYRYVLLEAGHVAQNMLLAGVEKNTPITPIGGVNDLIIEKELGLNYSTERVLYSLFF